MSLAACNLACRRGSRLLFDGLNFELQAGQALHLEGRNGAGKTSLLRLIAGLATPEQGHLAWNGCDTRELAGEYRRKLVYVGHANGIKEDMTAEDALKEWAHLAGYVLPPAQIGRLMEEAGVARLAGRQLRLLSQGQRRRVALARLLLARQRKLWVLDEPAVSLDEKGVDWVLALMKSHLAGGGLIVYATHQPLAVEPAALVQVSLGGE